MPKPLKMCTSAVSAKRGYAPYIFDCQTLVFSLVLVVHLVCYLMDYREGGSWHHRQDTQVLIGVWRWLAPSRGQDGQVLIGVCR